MVGAASSPGSSCTGTGTDSGIRGGGLDSDSDALSLLPVHPSLAPVPRAVAMIVAIYY